MAERVLNIPAGGSRTVIINECDISDISVHRVAETDSFGRFCGRIPFNGVHTFTLNYNRNLFVKAFAETDAVPHYNDPALPDFIRNRSCH